MEYCEYCDGSYNKVNHKFLCGDCYKSIYGSPPGTNSFMMQYEKKIQNEKKNIEYKDNFYKKSTLLDITAFVIVDHPELIKKLAEILQEGHPPWFSILNAWYIKNKCRKKKKIKYPMKHIFDKLSID